MYGKALYAGSGFAFLVLLALTTSAAVSLSVVDTSQEASTFGGDACNNSIQKVVCGSLTTACGGTCTTVGEICLNDSNVWESQQGSVSMCASTASDSRCITNQTTSSCTPKDKICKCVDPVVGGLECQKKPKGTQGTISKPTVTSTSECDSGG